VKELWEQTGTARFPEDALSLTLAATPYSIHLCRGLWLLLDTIEWLSRPAGLWASSGRWHDRRHRGVCGREPGFIQMKETLL